jgi:hypothetical protein
VLRVAGDTAGARDWGETEAMTHAADVDKTVAIGATARYDFGFSDDAHVCEGRNHHPVHIRRWDGSPAYFTREFCIVGSAKVAGTGGGVRWNQPRTDRPTSPIERQSAVDRDSPLFRICRWKRGQSSIGTGSITGRFAAAIRDARIRKSPSPARSRLITLRGQGPVPSRPDGRRAVDWGGHSVSVHSGVAASFLAESQSSFQPGPRLSEQRSVAVDTLQRRRQRPEPYRGRDHFYRVDDSDEPLSCGR